MNVFNTQHIFHDKGSKTQQEAFQFIAQNAYKLGFINDIEGYIEGLNTRESHSSTGFLGGIAIPHCKSTHVKNTAIFVVHFDNPITWETMDDIPVKTAVSLAIPDKGSQEALLMLTKLSRALMKPDIRNALQQKDPEWILKTIEQVIL